MNLTPEQLQTSKEEILKRVKEALVSFLSKKDKEHGKTFVALTLEPPPVQDDKIGETFKMNVVWGLYKVIFRGNGAKPEKINLENYDTEDFFKKVLLSLADNIAQKLQVKTLISTVGKNIFPEVIKGISNSLKPGQVVMIFKKNEEVVLTLNEGEKYMKTIDPDDLFL